MTNIQYIDQRFARSQKFLEETKIFGINAMQISDHVEFDPALAIKFTIYRQMPSGSPGDADIFGSQQDGPLLEIEVPDD